MFDKILSQIDKKSIMILSKVINKISYNKKNIYTLGVGKSNHVANLFSDQLKLLSQVSVSLNITNLSHGDIGLLQKDDLVIIISKSGNTSELINLIPHLIDKKVILFNISMNKSGKLNQMVDYSVILPTINEIDKNNLIPSNSIIIFTYYFNMVISNLILSKNLKSNQLISSNHPGGDLGRLSKIHT